MKGDKKVHKRTAEEWVALARQLGEDSLVIQRDESLNTDQKIKKQMALGKKMTDEIKKDPHLKEEEKKSMITSLENYLNNWKEVQKKVQEASEF